MFKRFSTLQEKTVFYFRGKRFVKNGYQHAIDPDGYVKHFLPNEVVMPHPKKVVRPKGKLYSKSFRTGEAA